jgi:N-acetylmuramoyl-L-alanine amidase
MGMAAIVAIAVALAVVYSGDRPGSKSTTTAGSTSSGGSSAARTTTMVIAWNPSHQDDTGADGWHEYAVCGDIAKRTMALLSDFTNVLCWDTSAGLSSKSSTALKSECDKANAANAQIFIAIHVNGGAGSGFTGDYYAGDTASGKFGEAVLKSAGATMGMTFYYVKPRSDLYVLNPAHNKAPIRVLLELGDNVADRALLTSAEGRQKLATALAKAVKENVPVGQTPASCGAGAGTT